ncbi:class I SAM-dependent methyltransferase [Bradyrhizobium sp. UFLA05-153]
MPEASNRLAARESHFSINATEYGKRLPCSGIVLASLTRTVTSVFGDALVAELGAGTGNLLRSFGSQKVNGYAVESSGAMRAVARHLAPHETRFQWVSGTAESCPLLDDSVNWVLLANVYHLVDPSKMFREAHRILKEYGFLTIIWNVRDLRRDQLQLEMEEMVKREVSDLKRIETSVAEIMDAVDTEGLFSEYCYVEARHEQNFTPERFLDAWKAGYDVPTQMSRQQWNDILRKTAPTLHRKSLIRTRWITRAWTFQTIPNTRSKYGIN